jgi:DNA segregation ATPase FtsK/SpoIIIE-like protein
MTFATSRRHCVIAIGALNSTLVHVFDQAVNYEELSTAPHTPAPPAAYDSFMGNAEKLCGKALWLPDTKRAVADFSSANEKLDVDFIWIFFNESHLRGRAVPEVITLASQAATVLLFCYLDEVQKKASEDATWPVGWPQPSHHRLLYSNYSQNECKNLLMLRWLLPNSRKRTQRPIYFGNEAREKDEYYERARSVVLAHKRPSISLVQRHLHIGYTHAVRLIDAMAGDILGSPGKDGVPVVLPL